MRRLSAVLVVLLMVLPWLAHAQWNHPAYNLEVQDARVESGEEPWYLEFEIEYTNAGAPVVGVCVWSGQYSGSGHIATRPPTWNVDGIADDGVLRVFGNGLDQQETQITYECMASNGLVSSTSGPITVPVP